MRKHEHVFDRILNKRITIHGQFVSQLYLRTVFNLTNLAFGCLIVSYCLIGCQSTSQRGLENKRAQGSNHCCLDHHKPQEKQILAIMNGYPIHESEMLPYLLEASGAEILLDHVLLKLVERHFKEGQQENRWGAIPGEMKALKSLETAIIRRNMSDDPSTALRLEKQMRLERGLGPLRYDLWLSRNALLRHMVKSDIEISEPQIKQAYQIFYGKKYVFQIIVTDSLKSANRLVRNLDKDLKVTADRFARLARQYSIDESRIQGGYLSPFNPADDQWPIEIRRLTGHMSVGDISVPVALPSKNGANTQVGILRLDAVQAATKVPYQEVAETLAMRLRDRIESVAMQKLSRELLAKADLVIMQREVRSTWPLITGGIGNSAN